jgi:Rne/Rng family ribonuclease
MPKELFIASSPHETKVAVVEDDSLVEVFYQRDTDVGLVGGIYKGRVSRVLPGMQSAFVDVGLERDAFLYVSDFFEDSDEYDRVVADAETRVSKLVPPEPQPAGPPQSVEPADKETAEADADGQVNVPAHAPAHAPALEHEVAAESDSAVAPSESVGVVAAPVSAPSASEDARTQSPNRPWQDEPGGRGRRRRRGRGRFGKPPFREREHERHLAPQPPETAAGGFEILPGESLARYGQGQSETSEPATVDAREPEASAEEAQSVSGDGLEASGSLATAESSAGHGPGSEQIATGDDLLTPDEAQSDSIEPVATASAEALEEDLLAGNLRIAPLPVEPDAPKHHAAPVLAGRDEELEIRSVTDHEVAASGPDAEEENVEAVSDEEPLGAHEADEETAKEEEAAGQPGEGDEAEAAAAGASSEEALQELPDDSSVAAPETGETGLPGAAVPSEGAENRSYTMRDQHQRPRFAPRRGRRGRGRFGNRGSRQEGQGRRPDFPRAGNEQPVQINEVLKEGQEILVQIAKEPLGTKGARITSHIALPGRYLVYMPTIHHIGVSRKIGTEEERLRLRNIILEHRGSLLGGIIVRTAAAGRSEEELKGDLEFLARLWHEIRTRTERTKAPALIHRDLTLVERILRDILSPEFKSVRVDNEVEYRNVLDFVHRFQPSLVGHVKLYTKDTPLFEEFGLQSEIDKALKPKVWLKSGGYIVINQTEALVAIDVNTGKYVGKTNRLEDTIVKTNIDAVKEIVRQVRLRDLGGIVVIDFIDMDDRRNRAKVVQALEEALRKDRAPTKILSFNEFGLVALTRKRVKQSLERTLSESCPYCTGSGWIKSVTTVCCEIMEEAKKMAQEIDSNTITLRVNPEVARALKSREGVLTAELESLTGKDVVIKGDPTVHQERFEIF